MRSKLPSRIDKGKGRKASSVIRGIRRMAFRVVHGHLDNGGFCRYRTGTLLRHCHRLWYEWADFGSENHMLAVRLCRGRCFCC